MTVLPFPYPTDKWCEGTLTPADGRWQQWYGTISVNTTNFAVGQSSIQLRGVAYTLLTKFRLNKPLSALTYPNGKLVFYVACVCPTPVSMTVAIEDNIGGQVKVKVSVNNVGVWEPKEIPLSDFPPTPIIDWSKITCVDFTLDKGNGNDGILLIDNMHFTFNVPDSTILLTSTPSGKSGVLNTSYYPELFGMPADFVTPSTIVLPQGLPLTVQMDVTNFDHWADDVNNINPTRSLTIPTTNLALQAVYAAQPNPNPLFVIDSFDQDMNNVSAISAVKLVYSAIPQVVNVPFGGKVQKGVYSLSAISTASRKFSFWKKPDGTSDTNSTMTWDVQSDSRFEVHWEVSGDGNGGEFPLLPIIIGVGVGAVAILLLMRR